MFALNLPLTIKLKNRNFVDGLIFEDFIQNRKWILLTNSSYEAATFICCDSALAHLEGFVYMNRDKQKK